MPLGQTGTQVFSWSRSWLNTSATVIGAQGALVVAEIRHAWEAFRLFIRRETDHCGRIVNKSVGAILVTFVTSSFESLPITRFSTEVIEAFDVAKSIILIQLQTIWARSLVRV